MDLQSEIAPRLRCQSGRIWVGGLFDLVCAEYDCADTVLIGATDGVGTKLKIANSIGNHKYVPIDLVSMCANSLIVAGGEALFFLDYFASEKLDANQAAQNVIGLALQKVVNRQGVDLLEVKLPRCHLCTLQENTTWLGLLLVPFIGIAHYFSPLR
jgi:phosphoribosylaminoimidazole (AIR) synthetase